MNPIQPSLLDTVEPQLPDLIGAAGWQEHGGQITQIFSNLRQANDSETRDALEYDLVKLLEQYPMARRAWRNARRFGEWRDVYSEAEFTKDVSSVLPAALVSAGVNSSYYSAGTVFVTGDAELSVSLTPGKAGKSIKFSNFRLDLDELLGLASGAVSAGISIQANPHPLVVVAGLLLTLRALLGAITVELSEQDTSVFWGFVQAADKDKSATEDQVFAKTNTERRRFGFEPLTELQFGASIERLKQLKSIEALGDKKWHIIERYRIRT